MIQSNIKIAVLGGRGMLGTDLVDVCKQSGFDIQVFDLPEFDITNEKHIAEAIKGKDAVINCAAYTNVEKAEAETGLAYKVNAEAVGKLGCIAKKMNLWVLHISTDFVFDGKSNRPYLETDVPNPINAYGKSKLAGERLLAESGCHHCIMRIEWTYGQHGNNFVKKLIASAQQNKNVKVVDDQIGSPTPTAQVADAICNLLSKKPEGLYHFASSGYVSRFDMAKFIFDKLAIPANLIACKTKDFPSAAQRPLNSCFDCSKIKGLLGEPIENWQSGLERFLNKL